MRCADSGYFTSQHTMNKKQIKTPSLHAVVYCASSPDIDKEYMENASLLGELFVKSDIACINGAGSRGLMGAINDTMLAQGGTVKGIIPQFMVDAGWCHPKLRQVIVTKTMHERKTKMAELADVAIALPGGIGTLEELAEILTWRQLGLFKKPVVILNINNYYTPLIRFFNQMLVQRFMNPAFADTWIEAHTPQQVMEVLNSLKSEHE